MAWPGYNDLDFPLDQQESLKSLAKVVMDTHIALHLCLCQCLLLYSEQCSGVGMGVEAGLRRGGYHLYTHSPPGSFLLPL